MPRLLLSTLPRPLQRRSPLAALAAALTLGLGVASSAQAQSLLELYDAARAYDAAYQSARAQAESTVSKAEQSRALMRPVLNATGTLAQSRSDAPSVAADAMTTTRAGQRTVALTGQMPLFNRANEKTIRQSERGIEVAQAQLQVAEQDLIVRVAQAYFDVLAATDALGTVKTSKAAIAEQLASAKRNFEVGTATITDTREAQARYDLATAQELAAENDLNVKRLALESVSGRPGLNPRPMAVPVVLPTLVPADVEAWVNQADAASPALQQLRLAREVARLETEKARAAGLPTLGLSGSLSEAHSSVASSTLGKTFSGSGFGPSATVALQLTLPLYTGGLVQNRIKETLALEDKAQSDLEAARRNTAQGTRSAFFGVRSLTAQVTALEAAESSSKLALEATQLGYKVGVRVNLDVLNAQTQLYQAQRDLAKARYDVVVNSLKLRQVTGGLQPQDMTVVDALLAR